jgi:hypothetical protein
MYPPTSRFSFTDKSSNTLLPCGQKLIPSFRLSGGSFPFSLVRFNNISPDQAGINPHTAFNKVDFPDPFEPITETISYLFTLIEASNKTCFFS